MKSFKLKASEIVTPEQVQAEELAKLEAQFSTAIQSYLDVTAQERRYDGIQTAITYRNDPNPQFAAEGEALFEWRSVVWTHSTVELDKVKAGQRDIPTVEDFIAELPAFEWPTIGDTNE